MLLTKNWTTTPRSIRTKLISLVLLLTLPLIVLLIYNNQYAIQVVRTQVADSYSHLLNVYMVQVDSDLEATQRFINDTVALDSNFLTMEQATDEAENLYRFAKIQLRNSLLQKARNLDAIGAFFVYHERRDDYVEINMQTGLSYADKEELKARLIDTLRDADGRNHLVRHQWVIHRLNDQYDLYYIMRSGELYLGARIPTANLKLPMELNQLDPDGRALYASAYGKALTTVDEETSDMDWNERVAAYFEEGKLEGYLVLEEPSIQGDFYLMAFIPDEKILANLPYLQQINMWILVASFTIIPFGLYYLRRTILVPLQRIVRTMKRVESENLQARVEPYPTSLEFQLVNETFNRMIDQIEDLKINVYEEQLAKQREELQRLQLQINPHFFMNSMNMLHSLTKAKHYEPAKELALCLIHYFRFMLRSSHSPFVLMKDELEHVRNYLRIQELRYPGKMSYTIYAPDYVEDIRIPPLLIQTFIENSVKHGITLDDPIQISVRVDLVEHQSVPCILIHIDDTGPGFSADILRVLQEGSSLVTPDGEHLGIWNVQRRLKLLYPQYSEIQFENLLPSGARIILIFPVHLGEQGA